MKKFALYFASLPMLFSGACKKEVPVETEPVYTDSYSLDAETDDSIDSLSILSLLPDDEYEIIQAATDIFNDVHSDDQVIIVRNLINDQLELHILSAASIDGTIYQQRVDISRDSLNLQLYDFDGDSINEITLTGNLPNGNISISVIKMRLAGGEYEAYVVFQQSFDGGVEIKEESDNFIIHLQQNLGSSLLGYQDNEYRWSPDSDTFVQTASRTVNLDASIDETLRTIYLGSVDNYIKALSGVWIYDDPGSSQVLQYILEIDGDERTMSIYTDSRRNDPPTNAVLEEYVITQAYKSVFTNLITVIGSNFVSNLQYNLTYKLESDDTLTLSTPPYNLLGNIDWIGTYRRADDAIFEIYADYRDNILSPVDIELNDLYSNNRIEIRFSGDRISVIDDGSRFNGTYTLFSRNRLTIIQMELRDEEKNSVENYTFEIDYQENVRESQTIKTIILYPASLDVQGVQRHPVDPIRLEQIISEEIS